MATSALSLNEQWLWLLERLTPGSIARTTATLGRRIKGPLDVELLQGCITELIRRHETLRTTFVADHGQLRRVVSADPAPEWIWYDLSSEPAAEREPRGLALMDQERTRHIDISQGKQTRCMLARISPTEHLMLFATHHLAADAASLVLLEEELSALYHDGIAEQNALVPESVPYLDYIDWQDRTLRSGASDSAEHWWQLIQDAQPLDLDAIFGAADTAQAHQGYAMTVASRGLADRQQVALGPQLSRQVHELMQSSRCSLFMVLLAGLQLVLYLRSGGQAFLIRTPAANRSRPEQRTMIGALETQTFVKCEIHDDSTFGDILLNVRQQVLSGLRHQSVPMSVILGSVLHRAKPASSSVAFAGGTAQFALFSHGRMASWPPSLEVSVCAGSRIGTASDLQVFAMEEGRRLDGAPPGIVLEANNPGGGYTPASVQDFLSAFRDVLASVVAGPGLTVGQLSSQFRPAADRAPRDPGRAPGQTRAGRPGRDVPEDLQQRLLEIARSACSDSSITSHESIFRAPVAAVETGVALVDAINTSGGVADGAVSLADLLEQPTVAGLAESITGRL